MRDIGSTPIFSTLNAYHSHDGILNNGQILTDLEKKLIELGFESKGKYRRLTYVNQDGLLLVVNARFEIPKWRVFSNHKLYDHDTPTFLFFGRSEKTQYKDIKELLPDKMRQELIFYFDKLITGVPVK